MNNKELETSIYYFHQGTQSRAYNLLGAHREGDYISFRVWAPNADEIWLVGDFNNWEKADPMNRISEKGVWEVKLESEKVADGCLYKYCIRNGSKVIYKSDPYGYKMQGAPNFATELFDINGYKWHDKGYMSHRYRSSQEGFNSQPINIYEIHPGSWKRHDDGSYYTYKELAEELAPYVKQMGYTHVELMPISEHPFDGSWGYQVGGYYAPTSRYGTPKDFMNFMDIMHSAGVGVILDWVPAHFPKDAFGLYEFDGQPLYEYQGNDRMESRGWGTRFFDVGREEIQSFLVSNAYYWLSVYHVDGLRVDAVASMIYLDYDRMPGEWHPNVYGDNRNLESIAFFRKLNTAIKNDFPDVMMIAEESGSGVKITGFDYEGLGFDFKWNMGWMNDLLEYAQKDPIYRKYHHDKLTFSLMYAFGEKYILPISHDEVVHGKKSFIDKMPGDYWKKFANARAFYAYQMLHPGKKLNFMSNEIAQFREWDYENSVEWFMLDYDMHAKYQLFVSDVNQLYLKYPELWQIDDSWEGFRWINADDSDHSILSFRRISKTGKELIAVFNFTPVVYECNDLKVPFAGNYAEIFNSDDQKYGGSGVTNTGYTFKSEKRDDGDHICFRLPPLGVTVFRCIRKQPVRNSKN